MSIATIPPVTEPVVNRSRFRLPPDQYVPQSVRKDLIVLHFTASSSAQSVWNTWSQKSKGTPLRVATAYVIDTDAAIFEFFPPEHWAWHLGMTGKNPGFIHDQRSIGIEIVNVGPLRPDSAKPNQLNWWPNNFGTRYCSLAETDKYIGAEHRGEKYFAAFGPGQAIAVRNLVYSLCRQFGIPRKVAAPDRLTACDLAYFGSFSGVASHQNFRSDKFDMGPAWDWAALEL